MKKTLLSALAALSLSVAAFAQTSTVDNTGIISFSGPGVNDGESSITLIYNPANDCNASDPAKTLIGSAIVNFHGSIAIPDATQPTGYNWQGAQQREWNKDANGNTSATDADLNHLNQQANGTWTLTFTPRTYFVNVPAGPIPALKFVLNGNTLADPSWARKGEARYNTGGTAGCGDFVVPFPIAANLLGVKSANRASNLSMQNQPNPFRGSTTIGYTVRSAGAVSLKVFNVLGEVVATLVDEKKVAGTHKVTFNAAGLNPGVYFYTTTIGQSIDTKKMLLVD